MGKSVIKPKTPAERLEKLRALRAALGLVRFEVSANPADHAAIKKYVSKLNKAREPKP